MRVGTFNILHGRRPGGEVDVDAFADCIRALDVDLLALQEVDVDQPRSGRADLTAVAADAMGVPTWLKMSGPTLGLLASHWAKALPDSAFCTAGAEQALATLAP